ncbi:murein DD-endopeptidase MepM/ murein hydrolase activator NlpD [Natronobacillus azotifigens]|uniref:M23 family metallopeptidase n=1 Tax=Natronobacillus azotifigens TaxID=472978 RepID=UPI00300E399E
MKRYYTILILTCFLFLSAELLVVAADSSTFDERMALYQKTEALTQVPWYYLAAIDQYERNTSEKSEERITSITFPDSLWFGLENIDHITDSRIIGLFQGIGQDGTGNNQADPMNDEDALYTLAMYIRQYGITEPDIKIALWEYYQRSLTVKTIVQTAKVYRTFNTTELTEHEFPVPLNYNYSYKNTWGDARGFGGRRIHEGTDIFAGYGTPVRATSYGVVEIKGWNRYGGWRIGIRDINNTYHYYAHLHGFSDDLSVGDVVQPGDIIGSVGSSGYGPPGTSGKFPPHLHYGMYKDNGTNEWAHDPYPSLRAWEKESRNR